MQNTASYEEEELLGALLSVRYGHRLGRREESPLTAHGAARSEALVTEQTRQPHMRHSQDCVATRWHYQGGEERLPGCAFC